MTAGDLVPAVFLDRDGVLNVARMRNGQPSPPATPGELRLTRDARRATEVLRRAGFLLVVVTNQPDVARGTLTIETVTAMHFLLRERLALDAVYFCPHDNRDDCTCRKPGPGMILTAAREHAIDLGRSWLIGDRWVDVASGEAAGVRTVLLERSYSWDATSAGQPPDALRSVRRARTLMGCVEIVLAGTAPADAA